MYKLLEYVECEFDQKDHLQKMYYEGLRKKKKKELKDQEFKLIREIKAKENYQDGPKINDVSKIMNQSRNLKDFYDYSNNWKNNADMKIRQIKQIKKEDEEIQLQNMHQVRNLVKKLPYNYEGPIKGWNNRFQNFMNKKEKQQDKENFIPQINEMSRFLANMDTDNTIKVQHLSNQNNYY